MGFFLKMSIIKLIIIFLKIFLTKISKQSLHNSCFGASCVTRKKDQILMLTPNIERERLVIIRSIDILPKKWTMSTQIMEYFI